MLTRTATRRSAAVLMVALVAMLLVATGGSARATPARMSAGTGHSVASPHPGRQVAAAAPASNDQVHVHTAVASTPPAVDPAAAGPSVIPVAEHVTARVSTDLVTAVGRGPPAL